MPRFSESSRWNDAADAVTQRSWPLPVTVRSLLGSVFAALTLVSCSDPPREPSGLQSPPGSQRQLLAISILTPTAWWLNVSPDGSGRIGYGSSIQDEARFPSGTFSFDDLRDELLATCAFEGSLARDPAATFVGAGPGSTESLYCPDVGSMAAVFERAVVGANFGGTRLGELHTAQPPISAP